MTTQRDRFPVVLHLVLERRHEGERRVLLLRRAHTGFMDGWYALPGGHLHHGESLRDAAARECREETGVDAGALEPLCLLPYRSGRHQGINLVFRATDWSGEPRLAEPELFDDLVWAAPAALPQPCAPWLPRLFERVAGGGWFEELYWD